jgi:hypothetical protein
MESARASHARELALVSRMTAAYAAIRLQRISSLSTARFHAVAVGELARQQRRIRRRPFAMDVNAIWAPHALEAIAVVFDALRSAGIAPDSALRASMTMPPPRCFSATRATLRRCDTRSMSGAEPPTTSW